MRSINRGARSRASKKSAGSREKEARRALRPRRPSWTRSKCVDALGRDFRYRLQGAVSLSLSSRPHAARLSQAARGRDSRGGRPAGQRALGRPPRWLRADAQTEADPWFGVLDDARPAGNAGVPDARGDPRSRTGMGGRSPTSGLAAQGEEPLLLRHVAQLLRMGRACRPPGRRPLAHQRSAPGTVLKREHSLPGCSHIACANAAGSQSSSVGTCPGLSGILNAAERLQPS